MATKVPEDLESLSDEKLQDLWAKVAEEALERREANKRVVEEIHKRETAASVKATYERLSDPERAALAQFAVAEGIASEEAVSEGEK